MLQIINIQLITNAKTNQKLAKSVQKRTIWCSLFEIKAYLTLSIAVFSRIALGILPAFQPGSFFQ